MIRLILAVVVGVVASASVVALGQWIGHRIVPPPSIPDPSDMEAVKAMIAALPPQAFIPVLASYFAGALLGPAAALAVARGRRLAGWTCLAILFLFAVANMVMLPHPLWFTAGVVVAYAAGGFIADRWLGRRA
jgi:hypothetical protein